MARLARDAADESYNFVNVALAKFGLNPAPCVAEHPVSEAIFNFVCARLSGGF